jgi:hypothetical protein
MKTRREFLATTIAAAALLTNSSGQTLALSGLSTMDEPGRKDTASNDPTPGGQYMTDRGEDPRITRARLSGPEQVTKDALVESIGYGVFPEDGSVVAGLPNIERTLNWVHLSSRFPVRVRIQNPDPALFRIGATAVTVVR